MTNAILLGAILLGCMAAVSIAAPLARSTAIDHVVVMEDYREGHHIRQYVIEGWNGAQWRPLAGGTSVGRMKIDGFEETTVSKV